MVITKKQYSDTLFACFALKRIFYKIALKSGVMNWDEQRCRLQQNQSRSEYPVTMNWELKTALQGTPGGPVWKYLWAKPLRGAFLQLNSGSGRKIMKHRVLTGGGLR